VRRRAPLILLGVLAAAVLAACGAGAGAPSTDARLLVTRDFGRTALLRTDHPELRGADTVMRMLQRNAKVTTRFGGGFVQSVDGIEGGQRAGRPVDWFFYVDGVLSERGAGDVRVEDGAAIWWDHHDWGSGPAAGSAVVGSFPAPFAHAATTALVCVPEDTPACAAAEDALAETGTRVQRGQDTARDAPTVVVGRYAAIREVQGARLLEEGPETSGVYARPARDGGSIALLDAQARRVRTLRGGAGLVAATRTAGKPPVWSVTGTDDGGLLAAAEALGEEQLAGHFAVAVDGGAPAALPVEAAR
jgi:hypothetical protein